MCMIYKGVAYDYAFEFKVPVGYSTDDKVFKIVASNFREDTQDFTGLCLENELMVVSDEKIPFEAFLDIVSEIVDITISSEKSYAEAHEGRIPVPHRKVTDTEFFAKFEERKKSKKSLDYYEQLRVYFEQPERITENISEEIKPDLWEYLNLMLFLFLLGMRQPQIKDVKFFKI